MKKVGILILSIVLLGFQKEFKISGKYKVVFDKKDESKIEDYIIEFKENNYMKLFNNDTVVGAITRFKNSQKKNTIYLYDFLFIQNKAQISPPLINYGKLILEIQESDSDTLKFRSTYDKQLHLTINTGQMIRLK